VNVDIITAYVGLGSNLGDRAGNLLLAVRGLMEASLPVFRLSGIYETEPVGVASQDNFLNMVAEIHLKTITPEQMLARMIRIEYLLGRRNKFEKAPRTVDLDLLFYGGVHYNTPFLTLPHPRLHKRKFVLVPMAELAPHFVHPTLNKSIQELLDETADTTKVKRWNPNSRRASENSENRDLITADANFSTTQ
jgi:2-amino-4-hydroxy-6-hydroxymethyldihydropteridine diphosphokinase